MKGTSPCRRRHRSAKPDASAKNRRLERTLLDVLELDAATRTKACASLLDALQEPRVGFKPIFKPIVLRLKPDQYPGWFAVARDDDILRFGFSKTVGNVVVD